MRSENRTSGAKAIGRNVLRFMGERGMSVLDLSRASGVGRDAIYNYLYGRSEPRAVLLVRLARGLGCDVNDLLEGVE